MKKLLVSLLLTAVILLIAVPAFAADLQGVDVYPLGNLKAGIKGTGYTVIRGTQIETFDVEILELIPKGGFDGGPMILAKFSGEVVDHSKGIAGGYSGSPVYIGGKLLGAVSMAIPFTDTHVGGITPIESMLPALPERDQGDYSQNTVLPLPANNGTTIDENGNPIGEPPGPEQGAPVTPHEHVDEVNPPAVQPTVPPEPQPIEGVPTAVVEMSDLAAARSYNDKVARSFLTAKGGGQAGPAHQQLTLAGVRATTPVLTSGISPQVMAQFKDKLQSTLGDNFTFEASALGGSGVADGPGLLLSSAKRQSAVPPGLFFSDKAKAPVLKPGSAVTVSLMQGDIEMNAIGTLTYSDPAGRFLIFGHPMMAMGPTNMPLGEGYVTWTHKSIERAFKDGVRLNTLGKLTQDRAAACGGTFNERADMVPVRVKVKDMDLGSERELRFEVIRHPDYTPILIAMGLAQASQQVLDRQMGGTMKMSYHFEGAGLKEPLRRTNYYSDDANVVFNGAFDIVPVANLLATNIYRDVTVTKVDLVVEITRNRVNASIDDAKIVWDKDKSAEAATATDSAASESGATTGATSAAEPPAIGEGEGDAEDAQDDASRMREARRLQGGEPAPPQQSPTPGSAPAPTSILGGPLSMMPNMADLPTFAPGDDIKVRVRLQPYRTDPVWREFSIKVPEDFPSGSTMIMVHGGGDLISPSEVNGKGRSLMGMGPTIDVKEHDLDSILDQVLQWPLNNELLLTLVRPFDPTQPQELTTTTPTVGPAPATSDKPADKVDAKYQMEWVIYNGFMLPVNIMTAEEQKKAAENRKQMDDAKKQMLEGLTQGAESKRTYEYD